MRLGTRLFLLVVLSSLLPAGLVLLAGWLQMRQQIHLWTIPSLESSLDASLQTNRVAYDRLRRHLETEGRVLAESRLMPISARDTLGLAALLDEGSRLFGIDLAQYYLLEDDGFRRVVSRTRQAGPGPDVSSRLRSPAASAMGPQPILPLRIEDDRGDLLAVPTYLWASGDEEGAALRVAGALVLGVYLGPGYYQGLGEVSTGLSLYRRLQEMGQVLRTGYGLLAGFVLLLSLGFSLWIARTVSGSVSRPVNALIRQMDAMGRGDRDEASGTRDGTSPVPRVESGIPEMVHLAEAFADLRATLQAYQARLVETERIRGAQETARFVAHEIRNTVTPVRASLSVLERQADAWPQDSRDRALRAIHLIRRESERLNTLAGTFSAYAQFPERKPVRLDLATLVEGLTREETPEGIRLTVDRRDPLPQVRADREEMERIFRNLVQNAADAMNGEGTLHLSLSSGNGGRTLRVLLSDSGRGMNAETLGKVFQPGFTTRETGTGLGLALVHSALSHYGGNIRLESEAGRGTRVYIELPAAENGKLEEEP